MCVCVRVRACIGNYYIGTETWPVGVYLQFIGGDKMGEYHSIALPPLAPGQLHNINVDLISPPEPGLYRSQWQFCTPNGIISAGKLYGTVTVSNSVCIYSIRA